MHKEEVIITPSKPRTSVRTTTVKADDVPLAVNHTVHLHSRLPSTDSGIQADGGFDSLSRYRGQHFISTCNQHDSADGIGSAAGISNCSSGYSSDLSKATQPISISTKVLPVPSQSFVASSKPIPPAKPNLTSSSSKTAQRSSVTSSTSSAQSLEIRNIKTTKVKPSSSENPNAMSAISNKPVVPNKSAYLNQNCKPSQPVANQRTQLSNQAPSLANQKPGNESVLFSSIKVISNDNNVKFSFSSDAASDASNSVFSSKSNSQEPQNVNVEHADGSVKVSLHKGPASNIFSTPGSTLRLQAQNTARQGQPDGAKNQGQGCIALTRPLRLGAPPKINVRTVQPTSLHSQPQHLVPVMQQEPQPQQQASSPPRMKPKIAPRPSVLAKAVSTQCPVVSTTNVVTTSATNTCANSVSSNIKTVVTSQTTEGVQKTEIPVVHRVKTVTGSRTEIPVTHVHRAPSHKPQLHPRPSSFGRYTPERDRQRLHGDQQMIQPIYENIRFNPRDGFDFDDADTRMRHAELILKRSDELLSDAVKVLGTSHVFSEDVKEGRSSFVSKSTDGSKNVDINTSSTSDKEHRIPIFDVRTGKFHSGTRRSYYAEFSGGYSSSSSSGEDKREVTWEERKERMNTALSWLKTELADLRDMDNTLISQFKRCQDTIEALKTQRDLWEGLSEEGEEGDYWDDYELNEFNKRYLDSPGGSSSSQFSPGSREPSLQDVTLISFPVPQLNLPQDKKTSNGHHGVKQDIEATL